MEITKGDRVKITLPNGYTVEGEVLTASAWQEDYKADTPKKWNIELQGPAGYAYWKQRDEGGTVELLTA